MEAPILRAFDASANRALEGLRVVEDYVRFVLDDRCLTESAKNLRHELARLIADIPPQSRHAARDTLHDVGTTVEVQRADERSGGEEVCVAALERTKQALRSLEEFAKLIDVAVARTIESLRYRVYTLEKATTNVTASRQRLAQARLYVIVDAGRNEREFEQLVITLAEAGADAIQLRDKQLDDRALLARARTLVKLLRGRPTLSIVNDRADLARLAGADGVHLGQDDLAVHDARTMLGSQALIGVSTHSLLQAEEAVFAGANYIGVGPTFPSETKTFPEYPGLPLLEAVAAEITLPTFAIGGINSENVGRVCSTGIHGVAVSSAVTRAADAAVATRTLREMLGPVTKS